MMDPYKERIEILASALMRTLGISREAIHSDSRNKGDSVVVRYETSALTGYELCALADLNAKPPLSRFEMYISAAGNMVRVDLWCPAYAQVDLLQGR